MQKILMWVGIGLGVVILEVAISYFVITQFGSKPASSIIQGEGSVISEEAVEAAEEPKVKKAAGKVTDADFDPAAVYTLSDFVVNPAFSQGKHFFVSTMVFAFTNASYVNVLTEREPLLMDLIITRLGKHRFEYFGDYNNRDSLKIELAGIAGEVLGIEGGVKVYFSKFVLQ